MTDAEPSPLPSDTSAPPPPAEPEAKKAPLLKNPRRAFLILGAVVAVLLGGTGLYLLLTWGQEDTDDANIQADVVPVSARVSAQVAQVLVEENAHVKQDQVLVQLDDREFLARQQQAEAELAMQQAQARAADAQVAVVEASSRGGLIGAQGNVAGSAAGVSSASAQVAAARAGLVRAQADLEKANTDLARIQRLNQGGAASQEQLDNARTAQQTAAAAVAEARANQSAAEDARRQAEGRAREAQGRLAQSEPIQPQLEVARAQAALAHARVKSAQAALDLARLTLSYTKITAPREGEVSRLTARVGQMLSPGQPIAELVPVQTYVIANFKETQLGAMRVGQRARVTIDAYGGRKLWGRIQSLAGGTGASFALIPPDNASGNFVKVVQRVPVRIAWDTPPAGLPLRAGLSVDATVYTR